MKLGIYGTGGAGREVYEIACDINSVKLCWEQIVFIDDRRDGEVLYGCEVHSFESFVSLFSSSEIEVSIAVGEPETRKTLHEKITNPGYKNATLIHPTANVSRFATVGQGCIIRGGAFVGSEVTLGENVEVQVNSLVGHNTNIGRHSEICSTVSIAGNCELGERVFLGQGSNVKEKISIGQGAVLAMGSSLFVEIPDFAIASGNPARIVGKNTNKKVFK